MPKTYLTTAKTKYNHRYLAASHLFGRNSSVLKAYGKTGTELRRPALLLIKPLEQVCEKT